MKFTRRDLLKKGALASAAITFSGTQLLANTPGESAKFQRKSIGTNGSVKLNSNENPYGPSDKSRQAVIDAISDGNRYPRGYVTQLKKMIADQEGLSSEHIMITAGSSELLGLAGLMFGLKGGNLISSQPTFDFLLRYSERVKAEWIKVPLDENHGYNLEGIKKKINNQTQMIFVCNPNNPTGIEIPNDEVKSFCQEISPRVPVYLDEAYIELSSKGISGSMSSMVADNRNLIVARTFSKIYGLAGLRIGYAIAHPDTIKQMEYYHTGTMITPCVTSLAAAMAALEDKEFFERCRVLNNQGKEKVYASFKEWGIEYLPSSTNFIFFKTDKFSVDIRKELERRNVYIRDYGHVPGWARVSIGTLDEMDVFLQETKSLMDS